MKINTKSDESIREIVNLIVYGTPDPQKMSAKKFAHYFPEVSKNATKVGNEIFKPIIKRTIQLLENKYKSNPSKQLLREIEQAKKSIH